ncbi:SRR1-like protein [Plasmodium gallinaceum]|uniref:SRR1-like protein n=1 Tax=Plasmodium gallinaceum TaxID=5849 RepID=A0A1J1GPG5_PLAGA|nr:SRR1-like protein [Plasmodium gallinaceum]CRG94330.1 SRR1-like protein [Plasmodium gallinaceum]
MENWVLVKNKYKLKKNKNKKIEELYINKEEEKYLTYNTENYKENLDSDKKHIERIYNEIKKVISSLEKSIFFINFQKKFNEINRNNINIGVICLGLGSLTDINSNNKKSCFYQLSFILLLKKIYKIDNIYIYDPKITKIDKNIYNKFNIEILTCLQKNYIKHQNTEEEEDKNNNFKEKNNYDKNIKTIRITNQNEKILLFMPHCDINLYGEILYYIFMYEKLIYQNAHFFIHLENIIFLGNSFDYYKDHIYLYKPLGLPSCILQMLCEYEKHLNIKINQIIVNKLKNHFKEAHFIFYILNYSKEIKFPIFYEFISAFNDLSITLFNKINNKLIFWSNVYKNLID